MVAVKAADVERHVAHSAAPIRMLLLYGPDQGRVRQRAEAAVAARVDDPHDPFQLVRLEGDAVADQPARLLEEITTCGLFGGRRAVWLRAGGKSVARAVEIALSADAVTSITVVEAGDLARNSPLRTVCERSPLALALPCYGAEGRDLSGLIDRVLVASGLSVDRDARALLQDSLGGDAMMVASELAKLALYCHGSERVTSADVEASLADIASASAAAAVDSAFCGRWAEADAELAQLERNSIPAAAVLGSALSHALALVPRVGDLAEGESAEEIVQGWRGLHFRRRAAVLSQLQLWNEERLRRALAVIQQATLDGRRHPGLASASVARTLRAISTMAAGSGRA